MNRISLNRNALKWIAIVCMLIDHTAWAFVETDSFLAAALHTVGRVTGPVMFYFLVEGYHHTSDLKRYIERLIIFAVVSHFPYCLFVNYGELLPFETSVAGTLLLGLAAIIALDRLKNNFLKWLTVTACICLSLFCDWAVTGVLVILAFGLFYGDRKKQFIAFLIAFVYKVVITYVEFGFNIYRLIPVVTGPFLALAVLSTYNGEAGKRTTFNKWAFYVIYPLQFLLIGGVWLLFN